MRREMLKTFPQLSDVSVDYAWGGHVAITQNRLPSFGRTGDRTFHAVGFSGQGVALTTLAGDLLAEAVAGQSERFDVFARIRHRPFPGGAALRMPLLVLAMAYYRLRDLL
jgi:gamma-glutamylputrescine oxidase